jgi:hypothetical protein
MVAMSRAATCVIDGLANELRLPGNELDRVAEAKQ